MKQFGHLKIYQATLELQAPLFIGSGEQISKKEYLYVARENRIYILNLQKFANYLDEKNLLNHYQSFLMNEKKRNISEFFYENKIRSVDYSFFVDYTIDGAGEMIEKEKLSNLQMFIKNAQGQPYIPGSSLKGALRTAMLVKVLLSGKRIKTDIFYEKIIQAMQKSYNQRDLKKNMLQLIDTLENGLFNTLKYGTEKNTLEKKRDAVQSVLKGIAISDSQPLGKTQLMLAQKLDRSVAGKDQLLPISRECLRPGTIADFTITLDQHIVEQSGWSMEAIVDAVKIHAEWQQEIFYRYFNGNTQWRVPVDTAVLWLGGGIGFANKTVLAAAIGEEKARKVNAKLLHTLFPRGNHAKDEAIGVAPHMQKLARYGGKIYRMGQCQLEVH